MLRFNAVTKSYGTQTAVCSASFAINQPMMVGILGRPGAGKSTLLSLIGRLTEATSGDITCDGLNVTNLRGAAKRSWQAQCAMLGQRISLAPQLDVVSNVLRGAVNRRAPVSTLPGVFADADVPRAIDILDRLDLADVAQTSVGTLSNGQHRRVAIARALMQDPRIILADEPIAALDPVTAQIVLQTLRLIHEQDGRMVIVGLPGPEAARRACDKVIGLRGGRIVFDGPPDELTASAIRDIYGVEAQAIGGLSMTRDRKPADRVMA